MNMLAATPAGEPMRRRVRRRRPAPRPDLRPSDGRHREDQQFLPAALEILETPASPVGLALIWIIAALATGTLAWAYFGRIDIVATAQGKIQPTGRVKVIQPADVGRIVALRVENGRRVRAGDTLAVLDSGEADADVRELAAGHMARRAEVARRRTASETVASGRLTPVPIIRFDSDIAEAVQRRETMVLRGDLGKLSADVAALEAQQRQKHLEGERYQAIVTALEALVATLQQRVDARAALSSSGSGSRSDLLAATEALQTQQAALATARGQLLESGAAVDVLKRSIAAALTSFASDNEQRLAEAERQADEIGERLAKARVRQQRMVLTSPIDGTVSALAVTTTGQVVNAGEEIMRIVPDHLGLEIEAYIPNRDIGFVHVGQEAVVKIESLPFTRYGTVNATLFRLASDAIPEPDATQSEGNPARAVSNRGFAGAERTQNLVFATTFKPDSTHLTTETGDVPLSPGMAVTVEIKTGSRRILEYLFSPLVEVTSASMRER